MTDRLPEGLALLQAWDSYSQENPDATLAGFGAWLQHTQGSPKETTVPTSLSSSLDEDLFSLWGRLMRFTERWAKRAFEETPIRTLEEHGILMYIAQHGSPTKSEVAQHSLMEQTTCLEILKRLQRQELLSEFKDPNDRRSRRVELTEAGRYLVKDELQMRGKQLASLMAGPMPTNAKLQLVGQLQELAQFQANLLQRSGDQPWPLVTKHIPGDIGPNG